MKNKAKLSLNWIWTGALAELGKSRDSYSKTGVNSWKAGINDVKGQLEGIDKNLVEIKKTEKD